VLYIFGAIWRGGFRPWGWRRSGEQKDCVRNYPIKIFSPLPIELDYYIADLKQRKKMLHKEGESADPPSSN
jgi:hypothetical protein